MLALVERQFISRHGVLISQKYYRWCYRREVPILAGQVDGGKENKIYQGLRLSTSHGNAPFTQLID